MSAESAHSRAGDAIAENRLRVLTLNLWNLNHWKDRRDEVVSWIEQVTPDVVGLQEVVRRDSDCQATLLGDRTGLDVEFGGVPRPDGTLFGNAILPRFPIVESELRRLPTLDQRD